MSEGHEDGRQGAGRRGGSRHAGDGHGVNLHGVSRHGDGRRRGGDRRDRGRRWLRGLSLLGSVLVLLLLAGGPASAHAALRGADPADGSVVKTAPRSITLTFTESVGLLDDSFRVFDPDNRRLETGEAEHADGRADTARVTLPAHLGTGTFTVAWRVVSADSHPIAGAFTFSIGEPSAVPPALPSTSVEDPATSGLFNIGRYLAYVGAALLIGAAAFVAVCGPPDIRPLRRLLMAGWWALVASTVFLLLLRAPYETGAGPAEALDPSSLTRTLGTRPGLALAARLVLLAAAAVLLVRQRGLLHERRGEQPSRAALVTGAALAVGLALTWASAEHASAGIQVPAAMTSSVLHLLAMAVWLGGLTALLLLLHRTSVPSHVVTRFSRTAGLAVTVLVVTGVYQSWRGLGSAAALTDTTYGRVLLAKLAAVALLLVAGAWSRRTVTGGTTTARATAARATAARAATTVPAAASAALRKDARIPAPVGGPPGPSTDAPHDPAAQEPAEAATDTATADATGTAGTAATAGSATTGTAEAATAGAPAGEGTAATAATAATAGTATAAGAAVAAGPDAGAESPGRKTPAGRPRSAAPLASAGEARRRTLRRSVLAEVVVSVVVLVLTTVLTGTLPGRAVAEAATGGQAAGIPVASVTDVPFSIGSPGGGARATGRVQVTLDPGRVGDNSVQAVVYGADGGFVSIPELRISFSLPDQDVGPLDSRVTDKGGYWAADAVNLPMPGEWEMKVTVRVSDIDQVSVTQPVRIER